MKLSDMKAGEKAVVAKLRGDGAVRRRIMDMGLTKGVEVALVKVAPLGDPLQITLRGYDLTLRKEDAERIEVA
ncbi:MAG: FeoA family protein [Coriobacteriia bacterium]|nr:FeoA family protein [Coriobacteriia bacterium]